MCVTRNRGVDNTEIMALADSQAVRYYRKNGRLYALSVSRCMRELPGCQGRRLVEGTVPRAAKMCRAAGSEDRRVYWTGLNFHCRSSLG